ncbi:MAG: DUF6588 family protein [Elusimicrobiota bacterium]
MKYLLFVFLFVFVLHPMPANADWIDDAKEKAEKELEPLVGDIGAGLAGGLYSTNSSINFPGLEAGVKFSLAGVSDDNNLITEDKIIIPWIHAGAALPFKTSIFLRGFSYNIADSDSKITLLGGGIKYSIIESKLVSPLPGLQAIIAYNMMEVSDLNINTTTIGLTADKKLPFMKPYIGISYDMTKSEIKAGTQTLEPKNNSMRIGGGAEINPFPLVYVNAGVDLIQENTNWEIGTGLRLNIPF